jgi:tRNA-specific 2-thiouridylase
MPLGPYLKTQVREIAAKHGLRTAEKSESREICFVADDDYRRFLKEHEAKEGRTFPAGEIVHEDGTVLGQHEGTAFYTIGQRRGLRIAYKEPLYVLRIDTDTNRVIVGENQSLLESDLEVDNINWIAREPSTDPFEAEVKIRYLHKPASALITPLTAKRVRITFHERQRAIAPGQSAVFYDGDIVLGGGVIA